MSLFQGGSSQAMAMAAEKLRDSVIASERKAAAERAKKDAAPRRPLQSSVRDFQKVLIRQNWVLMINMALEIAYEQSLPHVLRKVQETNATLTVTAPSKTTSVSQAIQSEVKECKDIKEIKDAKVSVSSSQESKLDNQKEKEAAILRSATRALLFCVSHGLPVAKNFFYYNPDLLDGFSPAEIFAIFTKEGSLLNELWDSAVRETDGQKSGRNEVEIFREFSPLPENTCLNLFENNGTKLVFSPAKKLPLEEANKKSLLWMIGESVPDIKDSIENLLGEDKSLHEFLTVPQCKELLNIFLKRLGKKGVINNQQRYEIFGFSQRNGISVASKDANIAIAYTFGTLLAKTSIGFNVLANIFSHPLTHKFLKQKSQTEEVLQALLKNLYFASVLNMGAIIEILKINSADYVAGFVPVSQLGYYKNLKEYINILDLFENWLAWGSYDIGQPMHAKYTLDAENEVNFTLKFQDAKQLQNFQEKVLEPLSKRFNSGNAPTFKMIKGDQNICTFTLTKNQLEFLDAKLNLHGRDSRCWIVPKLPKFAAVVHVDKDDKAQSQNVVETMSLESCKRKIAQFLEKEFPPGFDAEFSLAKEFIVFKFKGDDEEASRYFKSLKRQLKIATSQDFDFDTTHFCKLSDFQAKLLKATASEKGVSLARLTFASSSIMQTSSASSQSSSISQTQSLQQQQQQSDSTQGNNPVMQPS